ncbi:MAG: AraC family transcriptional regulator [bacterium]
MVALRVTDYPARGMMAPHYHDEPSLIVVVSGGYLETIRGDEVEHRRGQMLLYPAHAVHAQRFGSMGARKIVFTPSPASMDFLRDHGVSFDTARCVSAPMIPQLAHRALAEIRNDDSFSALALEGITMELVAAFARAEGRDASTAAPAWVRAARDAIRTGEDENLSVEAIATLVGKHPVHLAREFRRHFGTTLGGYRRQLRLRRAEEMLRRRVGLTEVALACGFASHSHFCRVFKAEYGVTPSEFRST